MTAPAGAPVDNAGQWASIDFKKAQSEVRRLQVRIAKAVMENKRGKVKSLQYILTHSFYAKVLAVRRVTSNRGRNTPGVDGVLIKGARAKWRAVKGLRRRGYQPKPLRRIYIPKKNVSANLSPSFFTVKNLSYITLNNRILLIGA